jgi:hypothetical protein
MGPRLAPYAVHPHAKGPYWAYAIGQAYLSNQNVSKRTTS